jgi:SAM-dependent methyltransferase
MEQFCAHTPGSAGELRDRHRRVLEIFAARRPRRFLDVGCGDGRFTAFLKNVAGADEAHGVELSPSGVEKARKHGILAACVDVGTERLPCADGFFDAVFAGEIIEHLVDPDHLLEEIHRVLAPGGFLVLTTPNLAALHNRLALLLGYQPFPMGVSLRHNLGRVCEPAAPQSLDHVRVFTLRSLLLLLRRHGFTVVTLRGAGAQLPGGVKFRLCSLLERLLARLPSLSYRVVLVCEKRSPAGGAF